MILSKKKNNIFKKLKTKGNSRIKRNYNSINTKYKNERL